MRTVLHTDVLVIGGGIAGLLTALQIAAEGSRRVTLLAKAPIGSGASSGLAQGGVAAAVSNDDNPGLHAADTHATAGGLGENRAIERLTSDATKAVASLRSLGVNFDLDADGMLLVGREAAHSRRRILHAGGDSTGAEIMRALGQAVVASPSIDVMNGAIAKDLIVEEGRVVGAKVDKNDAAFVVQASAVVMASGGLGALYRYTTNPHESVGDGLAMAARAGARLADMEFVQFHPTAIEIGGDPLPLATEALRGEGATLVTGAGVRFMTAIHEDAELAPRDVVARAIWRQRKSGQKTFLDCRLAVGKAFPTRFPTVYRLCQKAGLDPVVEPIPVVPAAHYHMGGIAVDENGLSSVPGLWACGEVTSTGVHGANRLASNSLLEAAVFAPRVAASILKAETPAQLQNLDFDDQDHPLPALVEQRVITRLRHIAYDAFGLAREDKAMRKGLREILDLAKLGQELGSWAIANQTTVMKLLAVAALCRKESRGSHFRADFPEAKKALQYRQFFNLDETNTALAELKLGQRYDRKKQA